MAEAVFLGQHVGDRRHRRARCAGGGDQPGLHLKPDGGVGNAQAPRRAAQDQWDRAGVSHQVEAEDLLRRPAGQTAQARHALAAGHDPAGDGAEPLLEGIGLVSVGGVGSHFHPAPVIARRRLPSYQHRHK